MTPTQFLDALDAASEGATETSGPWAKGSLPSQYLDATARHIAAHSPAVTAALRACARALGPLLDEYVELIQSGDCGHSGDGSDMPTVINAREALAALAAAGGES